MESTKAKASWESLRLAPVNRMASGIPTVAYQMAFAAQLGPVGGIRAGL
jgi:hypothetical protein